MESSGRPLTAKEKRKEQLKRWINSATDVESSVVQNLKPKVKFNNGAVFLAACSSGDLEEVQALIKKGADINYANIDGLTALHQACIDGNFDVVEFLVKKGAEIDQDDNEGWTPLHAATSCGLVDIASYLVQKGANVAAVNSEGEVPIDIAEDDEMVEFLQQEIDNQGLDIDRARNSEREDMTVDANQQLNAIRNGQSPEIYRHPKSGASALHVAAAKGYISVIKILLQAGMDVDLRDNDGWTPLHAAAHWSQEEAAKLLADKYANFNLRNKLGQTPCDVADEDMFEYLKELKEEQEKNPRNLKESKFIEPPASFTSPSPNISSIQDVHKEKKPSEKKTIHNHSVASPQKHVSNHDEENSFSSDDVDIDSSSSSEVESSKHSQSNAKEVQEETGDADRFKLSYTIGRTRSSNNMNTSDTVSEITPRLRQSSSGSNVSLNSEFAGRRHNRPASLHIPPTQPKESRPSVMSATENYRPVATTRPIQSSKSSTNGPNAAPSTSTERNIEIKEDSPGTWRSGLRKTGSFDDKMRPVQRGGTTGSFVRHTDAERSASVSTSEDVTNATGNIRTARVAPILDGRITNKLKNEDNEVTTERFSFPRSGSYQRRGSDSSKTTTSAPMTYKRSISYKKAVGRTVSADQTFVTSPRRSSLRSVPDEKLDDQIPSPPSAGDATSFGPSATFELGEPRLDRRRSYLQPVRDEEAEAQRKARSRRERKSRRSTQGVTLDVFEEAKKTIKHMKDERNESAVSSDYSKKPDSSELTVPSGAIPHNDSTTILHRRMGVGASSPRAVTLPSSYIPSNERVASNLTNSSTDIPSINNPDNDEPDKQTTEMKKIRDERPLESSSHRNSTAQQRRRQRKDRRSTGLPGLATESGTDIISDEEEPRNDDTTELAKAERLRSTASRYDSSSLPDRGSRHRSGLRTSDSDLSRYSTTLDKQESKDFKKLYDDQVAENKRLKNDLSEARRKISELETKLSKIEDPSTQRRAIESERRERRAMERKLAEVEKELLALTELRSDNQRLKDENGALIRVISKLSK